MMKLILPLVLLLIPTNTPPWTIDFGHHKAGQDWRVINDGVMGGLSEGRLHFSENGLRFAGNISLANNGGFASVRSPFQQLDLSNFKSLQLRYRASGMSFALCLENDRRFYRPNYKYVLPPTEEWREIQIDLLDLKEYVLGSTTGSTIDASTLSEIIRIGFISNSKKEGPFTLEVDYLIWE